MTNDNLGALSTSWDRREDTYTLKINRDQKNRGSGTFVHDRQRNEPNQGNEASPTKQVATKVIMLTQ